ncbi:MAG: type II secretion system F family protein [Deltaproteobacteria bacterium]|nr:type II secretion system F family protein [Deltaproteobacteria bacterium]
MTAFNIVLLFFIAFFLAVIAVYLWYAAYRTSPRYLLKKRMRSLAVDTSDRRFPQELRVEILGDMSPLDKLLLRFPATKTLDKLINTAGVKVGVKTFLLLIPAFAVIFYMIGLLFGIGAAFSLLLAPVGAAAPFYYLYVKKQKRLKRFTEQLPDAVDMVARSLKAGHSLGAALQLVGNELPDPAGGLFKTAYEEQSLGLSMREALDHISRLMPSNDLRFLVLATNIHREVGGNLGEILERLAQTIRERLRIRRQVRVYTAQARLSGYVLSGTPLFMAVLLYFMFPGYIQELFTVKWGTYAVYIAVAAQVAGFLVIKKIINIKI